MSSNDWMVSDESNLYKPYFWDRFIDSQKSWSNRVGFITSYGASPSNVSVGDYIEIDQFYPYLNTSYQATASIVTNVGSMPTTGAFGFTTDIPFGLTSSLPQPGIWRNKMQWYPIKNWEHDKSYLNDSYVMYEGIPFKVVDGVTISNPLENPTNLVASYSIATNLTQFWNPTSVYSANDWVYIYDEYYYLANPGPQSGWTISFWDPTTAYTPGQIVNYQNQYFISATAISVPVGVHPVVQNRKIQSSSENKYWSSIVEPTNTKWSRIQLWDKNSTYTNNVYVVKDEILYIGLTSSSITIDDIPGYSSKWQRLYSFVPDTSFIYGTSSNYNSVIKIGDSYYYCLYNPNITLDSGITIYINKKWKNVLVNIAINDNTITSNSIVMDETRNLERDHLYVETNGRLTAANFIRQINDLDTIYGFADYTSYVVIEEDGSFKKYKFGNNIQDLPFYLICEEPDALNLKNASLQYNLKTLDKNTLKPFRYLNNGEIGRAHV